MEQINDSRIEQCLNDIQKYKKWGNLLAGQSWLHLFNSKTPVSVSAIHNGLECVKAKMKLSVLQDNRHSDKEKENRLKQIDIEIHQTEEMMKNDLEYRSLLMP
jgi:predicted HAD superfamily hydrolase